MRVRRRLATSIAAAALLAAMVSARAFGEEATSSAEDPGRSGFVERVRQKAKAFSEKLDEIGLHPVAGGFGNGGTFAPGASYWRAAREATGFDLFLSGAASLEGDRRAELRLGRVPHRPSAPPGRRQGLEWIPAFEVGRRASRHFTYFETSASRLAPGRFLHGASDGFSVLIADVVLGYRLTPRLVASARAGVTEVWPGTAHAPPSDPRPLGVAAITTAERRSYARVSAEVAWEARRRPRSPRSGSFATLRLDHYDDTHSGGFNRASIDLRRFQPLGSPRHILAVRALAVVAGSDDGSPVPFYLEPGLGGNNILRSYDWQRFSGNRMLGAQAEYRFEAVRWLELAAFLDLGRAWQGLPSFASDGVVGSYGFGARLRTPAAVAFRLDLAFGAEGARLNAAFCPAP